MLLRTTTKVIFFVLFCHRTAQLRAVRRAGGGEAPSLCVPSGRKGGRHPAARTPTHTSESDETAQTLPGPRAGGGAAPSFRVPPGREGRRRPAARPFFFFFFLLFFLLLFFLSCVLFFIFFSCGGTHLFGNFSCLDAGREGRGNRATAPERRRRPRAPTTAPPHNIPTARKRPEQTTRHWGRRQYSRTTPSFFLLHPVSPHSLSAAA